LNKKKNFIDKFRPTSPPKNEVDWWDEISEEEKASIERGLADVKAGRIVPHDEVRKKYLKWLNK
jgi:hypothetical protein